jgi:Flavoprotein
MTQPGRVLTVIVCAAGPASEVGQLVKLAQDHGWTVYVVSTPAALDFLDVPAIEAQTGNPVRSQYRKPGEPRSRPADAIIVAPATYNTINKWAQGISDTYALGILAETTALGIPIIVVPFVNSALAARAPFRRSVEDLGREGIHVLLGSGGVEPHEPHTGAQFIANYPWHLAVAAADRLTSPRLCRRYSFITSFRKPKHVLPVPFLLSHASHGLRLS